MADILTVIGSGGKSSCIYALAAAAAHAGKRVLITTTTHMAADAPCPVTETGKACRALFQTHRIVLLAGRTMDKGTEKLCPPALAELAACLPYADIVLNEGDGSAGRPLKVPAEYEPVILEGTQRILLGAGLMGLYRPIQEVCHRIPQVCACLGKAPEDSVTEEDVVRMLRDGYLRKLKDRYPGILVEIFLNQADTEALVQAGLRIQSRLPVLTSVTALGRESNGQFIQNVLASYIYK